MARPSANECNDPRKSGSAGAGRDPQEQDEHREDKVVAEDQWLGDHQQLRQTAKPASTIRADARKTDIGQTYPEFIKKV